MTLGLKVQFSCAEDLAGHLRQHQSEGALLLPMAQLPDEVQQYQALELQARVGDAEGVLDAEVLQVIPGLGLVVRLADPTEAALLSAGASAAEDPAPPQVEQHAEPQGAQPEADGEAEEAQRNQKRGGSTPLSWPIERLLAEWNGLTVADKFHAARRGKVAVRRHIIKGQDRALHAAVLTNPQIKAEEVAALVAKPGLDPALLRRIANSSEWSRNMTVARALIRNPKIPMQTVSRLLDAIPASDLRRLSRTGNVRSAVKRIIIQRLERGGGRKR